MKKHSLVIGNKGQIGSAIQKILDCEGIDLGDQLLDQYEYLHVCIPYSENFVEIVKTYTLQYNARVVVVHSTVPVGTCKEIGKFTFAVYSPCRGIHPHLELGIRTFVKYFAGYLSSEAAVIFKDKGISCVIYDRDGSMESLEAAKLWDTTQYGWNILLEKIIHKYCLDNGLDFGIVYSSFNQTYNDGYEALGLPQYKKYILGHMPGPIGGHCVMNNLDLLDSPVSTLLKDWKFE